MTRAKTIRDINLPCQRNMCFSMALKPVAQIASPVPNLSHTPASQEEDHPAAGLPGKNSIEPKSPRERLIWAMEECGWVQAKAARLLGMTTRQMNYALQKYNIEIRKF